MGLAGPKKRTKISNDPNNTQWSKSTTSFGHKILASQGWKPGEYLGAKNANHAEHYTKANASHIRVLLKDDNLGLGAKVGNQNADTFGLSQFSGLLGRLNGKSDEALKKEEDSRRDVELRLYHARKSGTMNFVSAGFLVGDKIEARQDWGNVDPGKKTNVSKKESDTPTEIAKTDKKRKRDADATADSQPLKEKKKKKTKKSGDTDVSTSAATTENDTDMAIAKSRTKETKEERRARKAAKAAARLEKQKRKDAKRAAKASKAASTKEAEPGSSESSSEDEEAVVETISVPTSAPTSGTSTPTGANPRRMIRSRYIASKRMASMDPNALKEIFMIKGSA